MKKDICHFRPSGFKNGFGVDICGKKTKVIEEHTGFYGFDKRVICPDGHRVLVPNGESHCNSCELKTRHGLAGIYDSLGV